MAASTRSKLSGAIDGLSEDNRITASAFSLKCFIQWQIPLVYGGLTVSLHTLERKAGNLVGQRLCGLERRSVCNHAIGKANPECFIGGYGAAGEDHIHGHAVANDPR